MPTIPRMLTDVFRRSAQPDLLPALEIEMRLRAAAEEDLARLRIQLAARDADVARLQRENDDLLLGVMGRVTRIAQRRDMDRLMGRDAGGRFAVVA